MKNSGTFKENFMDKILLYHTSLNEAKYARGQELQSLFEQQGFNLSGTVFTVYQKNSHLN